MILTGVNSNVIMSGCGDNNLTMQDEKRIEVIQRVFRGELTVGSAAVMLGIRNGSFTGLKDELRNKGPKE